MLGRPFVLSLLPRLRVVLRLGSSASVGAIQYIQNLPPKSSIHSRVYFASRRQSCGRGGVHGRKLVVVGRAGRVAAPHEQTRLTGAVATMHVGDGSPSRERRARDRRESARRIEIERRRVQIDGRRAVFLGRSGAQSRRSVARSGAVLRRTAARPAVTGGYVIVTGRARCGVEDVGQTGSDHHPAHGGCLKQAPCRTAGSTRSRRKRWS